ncbi:MAG: GNAT family N-acetyltransferase [Alphaproteobacteria bacterium]
MSDDPSIRPLTEGDLDEAVALSRAVGWPHRREDWQLLRATSTAFGLDHRGTLIGTAMAWTLGPRHLAVGMVIVAPDRQGGGRGRRLMDAALAVAGDRSVILNATDAGISLYERLGFRRTGTVQQHQGVFAPEAPPPGHVRPMRPDDRAAIVALDRVATGVDRAHILDALAAVAEGIVVEQSGAAVGFAFCRRFGRGHLIGPVVAPDAVSARLAIGRAASAHAGQFLRVDVPEDTGLGDWLAGLGLAPVAPVAPMVRGTPPAPDGAARTFALVAQAIG